MIFCLHIQYLCSLNLSFHPFLVILPVLPWNIFYSSSAVSFLSSIAFTYKQMCVKQFRNMPERNMIFPCESINPLFFLYYLYNSYKWCLHNSIGRLSKWNVNAVLVWEKIHVDCSAIVMLQDHFISYPWNVVCQG